eukprot:1887336-Prymnesium_polylepis.1
MGRSGSLSCSSRLLEVHASECTILPPDSDRLASCLCCDRSTREGSHTQWHDDGEHHQALH